MTAPTLLSTAIEMCFTARQQEKGAVAKCKFLQDIVFNILRIFLFCRKFYLATAPFDSPKIL